MFIGYVLHNEGIDSLTTFKVIIGLLDQNLATESVRKSG